MNRNEQDRALYINGCEDVRSGILFFIDATKMSCLHKGQGNKTLSISGFSLREYLVASSVFTKALLYFEVHGWPCGRLGLGTVSLTHLHVIKIVW